MAKIYYDLIKAGLRTIDEVPIRWRNDMENMIDLDVR